MKALVYLGTNRVDYLDQPRPEAGPGEALVQVEAVGICGSDLHAYHGHDPRRVPPMILGHEAAGRVVEGSWLGRRVTFNPIAFCRHCEYCLGGRQNLCANRTMIGLSRPGAFAQYLSVPEHCLIALPEDLDPVAAALTEPCATALHGVNLAQRAAWAPLQEGRALVLGAGAVGLLTTLLLRQRGCREIQVSDTNPLRRRSAAATGQAAVLDPALEPPAAESFDLVFDAVGATVSRATAVEAVRPGGVIVHLGLLQGGGELDVRKLTLAEISFVGAYTYSQSELRAAAALLHAGVLGALHWVERRTLAEGARAFDDLHRGRTAAAKVVLQP